MTNDHAEMVQMLDEIIHHDQDHVVVMDMGLAEKIEPKVVSLGQSFRAIEKGPIIV